VTSLDDQFQEYFGSLDKAGEDRCYLCRRTPADVKAFFGFAEDGTPLQADEYGIEDVVLYKLDIMSYAGSRPVCAVCQLNFDTMFAAGDHEVLKAVLREVEHERDRLWPAEGDTDAAPNEPSPRTDD
jgi:hypothetical protein